MKEWPSMDSGQRLWMVPMLTHHWYDDDDDVLCASPMDTKINTTLYKIDNRT